MLTKKKEGKPKYLGLFTSELEASEAYKDAFKLIEGSEFSFNKWK